MAASAAHPAGFAGPSILGANPRAGTPGGGRRGLSGGSVGPVLDRSRPSMGRGRLPVPGDPRHDCAVLRAIPSSGPPAPDRTDHLVGRVDHSRSAFPRRRRLVCVRRVLLGLDPLHRHRRTPRRSSLRFLVDVPAERLGDLPQLPGGYAGAGCGRVRISTTRRRRQMACRDLGDPDGHLGPLPTDGGDRGVRGDRHLRRHLPQTRVARSPQPIGVGLAIGWLPWVVEMSLRFGGPLEATRRSRRRAVRAVHGRGELPPVPGLHGRKDLQLSGGADPPCGACSGGVGWS